MNNLAAEVMRQEKQKTDLLVRPSAIVMEPNYGRDDGPFLRIGGGNEYAIGPVAHEQMGSWLGIPRAYYVRMLADAPGLLAHNVNAWLAREEGERRLVRTLDERARAILSNAYRPIDNLPVLHAVLEGAANHDLVVKSCEVTERRLYLQLVSPRLQAEVKVGDPVQAGLLITNSEVGLGMVKVELLIFVLVCGNGAVVGQGIKRRHVGRRLTAEGGAAVEYRPDTVEADQRAFQLMVRDNIAGLLTDEAFGATVDRLRGAAEREIPPAAVTSSVEEVTKRYRLTAGEGEAALVNLIAGRDYTAWGLSNAVTAVANNSRDYDRGVELERIGGDIVDLSPSEWGAVVKVGE